MVNTDSGSSEVGVSLTGTGAGRATGGPAFNIAFHHQISTDEKIKTLLKKIAPFADDSNVKTKIEYEPIKEIIKGFMGGEQIGLFMHKSGSKGPTVLVHNSQMESTRELLARDDEEFNDVDINVVNKVKFLGLDIFICEKFNIMAAKFPIKTQRLMSFYVSELNQTFRLTTFTKSVSFMHCAFFQASQTIASTIESRIQYALVYADTETLCMAFNYHRRAICALTGKSFRFFGFKNYNAKKGTFITDLYEAIQEKSSMTYTRLCKALGRPTMLQMALRAVTVVEDQCDLAQLTNDAVDKNDNLMGRVKLRAREPAFVQKIKKFSELCDKNNITNSKPRNDEFYCEFAKIDSFQGRRNFLKALTDNLMLEHLKSKGWNKEDMSCRVKGCDAKKENIGHIIDSHMNIGLLPPGIRRDLNRMRKIEEKTKEKERVVLEPSCKAASEIAKVFTGVGEPYLKIRKKNSE